MIVVQREGEVPARDRRSAAAPFIGAVLLLPERTEEASAHIPAALAIGG